MSVRQQFVNDKLGNMLTLPLALCCWQPVNVREVTCSASPWMWRVARVTLVKCCTPSILQILIDRIKSWVCNSAALKYTYTWIYILHGLWRQRGQVFYNWWMLHVFLIWPIDYQEIYYFLESTTTFEGSKISKGMKYTFSRHSVICTETSFSRPITVPTQITGIRERADVLLCLQLETLRTFSPENYQWKVCIRESIEHLV